MARRLTELLQLFVGHFPEPRSQGVQVEVRTWSYRHGAGTPNRATLTALKHVADCQTLSLAIPFEELYLAVVAG
jgi:hypothetical protein